MELVHVIAGFKVDSDIDEVVSYIQKVTPEVRKEAGCIAYDLTQDPQDPKQFYFVERWESREHLDTHMKTEMLAKMREFMSGKVSAQTLLILKPIA